MGQTRQDLAGHLIEQLGFLRASCAAFDAGTTAEAKRIATTIRVLVHDTHLSHSLLDQLGVKERLMYLNTSLSGPRREVRDLGGGRFSVTVRKDAGLAFVRVGVGRANLFGAPLDRLSEERRGKSAPFAAWWESPVLVDCHGNEFSRRALVLALVNREGGAHVDPELEPAYAALSRSNSLGISGSDSDGNFEFSESPVPANVRQIAYELQASIDAQAAIIEGSLAGTPATLLAKE